MRFRISVPATSANVGPGFDVMGLAFDMYNRFTFDTDCPEKLQIEGCRPEFADAKNNLLYTTLTQVLAQHGRLAPNLRITFDTNIRYRTEELSPSGKDRGKTILPSEAVILEVKTGGGMPLWLSRTLDELKIYPGKFSKYGRSYLEVCDNKKKGELLNV
jgi:hypothetical protein